MHEKPTGHAVSSQEKVWPDAHSWRKSTPPTMVPVLLIIDVQSTMFRLQDAVTELNGNASRKDP
jgi:hypothetical protein